MKTTPDRALLVDDPSFDAHALASSEGYHPERPERLVAARAALGSLPGASWTEVAVRSATVDEVAAVHDRGYLASLAQLRGRCWGRDLLCGAAHCSIFFTLTEIKMIIPSGDRR